MKAQLSVTMLSLVLIATASAQPVSWTLAQDALYPFSLAGSGVLGNYLYVFSEHWSSSTAQAFNLTTELWEESTPPPLLRLDCAGVATDSAVYLIAGYYGGNQWDVQKFVPDAGIGPTGDWTTVDHYPLLARGVAAAWDGGNYIYAAGGYFDQPPIYTNAAFKYDIANNVWTQIDSMPIVMGFAGGAFVLGKFYAVGGVGVPTLIQEYDPGSNTWRRMANIPELVILGTFCTTFNDSLIYTVGGGDAPDGMPASDEVQIYNPLTNTWYEETPLPVPVSLNIARWVGGGKIISAGGSIGASWAPQDTTWKGEGFPTSLPSVTVTLEPINPPIQIPASGGSFSYNATINNLLNVSSTFDVWIMAQLPDSSWYGPVLGPITLTLPAAASITRQRTQPVPGSAPSGTFVYEGRVGIYPGTVWNTSSFTFAKTLEGSQLWATRYNGPDNSDDEASSLAVDGSGNVYVTGYSNNYSLTSRDYATLKYNAAGVQQWIAYYTGPVWSWDCPTALVVDSAGNSYVTGYSMGSGTDYDYATIKYNSAGVQQWEARYNGPGNGEDEPYALAIDAIGNVYVTGRITGGGTAFDYATIKYNSAGVQQWEARYNGTGNSNDEAHDLAVDESGNVYVTGWSVDNVTFQDYVTIKYDAAGVQQWEARYNGPGGFDFATSLVLDQAGNVFVTGYSSGSMSGADYATVKYNAAGIEQWVARYDGPAIGYDYAYSLAVDGGGNVYVTGNSDGGVTGYDFATLKYDAAGVRQWVARYNGPGNGSDAATSVALDGLANVYIAGFCLGASSGYDYTTIKYNSAGLQQWIAWYNGPANSWDQATALAVDGAGNAYVTGNSVGSGTGYCDYATVKYSGGSIANWQSAEELVLGSQQPVTEYKLLPNYPNPFNPTTTISYKLQAATKVKLEVFDISGRLVTTLVNGWREAGTHELTFEGTNLPSGIYLAKLTVRGYTAVQKMVLVK